MTATTDRVTPGAVGLLLLGSLGYGAMMFSWFSLPAYLPTMSADLGLSGTQAGALAGAVPLTYVPVSLVSGLLVDRLGHRRVVGAGVALVGVAHLGRGYAAGFPAMLALTALLGVGGTGVTFGLPKLVAALFPAERSGVASTVYLLGAYAGTATAFAVGRSILGPALGGWRPFFRVTGLAVLGIAAAWAVAAVVFARGRDPDLDAGAPVTALRGILASRQLRLLVVVGFVYLLVAHGLQGMLQTVLESRGLDAARAARATTLLVVAQVVGVLVVPAAADATGRRRLALVGSVACCTVGVAALVAWVADVAGVATPGSLAGVASAGSLAGGVPAVPVSVAPAVVAGIVPVVLVGFGLGGIAPLLRALPPELEGVGAERTGVAVGLVFAVGETGGFLGPFAIGALGDLTGSYAPGLGILLVGTLAALVAGAGIDV